MPIIIDPRTGLPVPRRTDRAPRNKRQGGVPGPGDVAQIDAQVLRDPGVHATPAEFGAGIGKAIEQFGAAASRVASDFAEMRREAEDDTAAMAGLSEARARFTRVARSVNPQATTAEDFTGNLDRALGAETDAILRDLRQARGLRPSKGGEATIRRRLGLLASRMVARGAMFEQTERLAQLGRDVDLSVAEAALAAFDSPADFLAIMGETEASLARFKNKLPPDILAAKVAAARGLIAANAAAGLIELDPALAIEGLKGEFFGDSLPAADRKSLRARAKAARRDRRAQAELDQIRERATAGADGARRLVALEGAIGRGEAGEQAIAEAADILDHPTRARLHEKLDARRADDAARDRRIEKVSAVLAGRAAATGEGNGKPDGGGDSGDTDLPPGAPGWPQAVDDHYASLANALETMDPDERARFEDDYARATGVLPEPVLKQVRAGLLSADPAAQAAAAQRLARLNDDNPALVSAIPAHERRRARAIAEFADLGLSPARAVELAEEKRADVGENDQPAGSAGDDTPDKDVIENTADGGTGEDTLEGGAGETRQTPKVTPATIAEFFDNAAELGGQDFADAAIAAGMDPGRAALVRDIFRSTEDDRTALIERINEQPRAFRADFKSLLGAMRAAGDDQEARRRVLLTTRGLVRAESQGLLRDAEKLGAAILGTRGRPGARPIGKAGHRRSGTRQLKPLKRPRPEPEHPRNRNVDEAVKTKGLTKPKPQMAEDINKLFPQYKDSLPARPGTKAWRARMKGVAPGDFVRLHTEGAEQSFWIMRREQVVDAQGRLLPAKELQRKFALPEPPTHISDVTIPQGNPADIHISIVRPVRGWKRGDVVQYNFDRLPSKSWFLNTKPLAEWRY